MALLQRLAVILVLLSLPFGTLGPVQAVPAGAPQLLTPQDGEVMNHLQFEWRPVGGATKYRLEVSTDHRFLNNFFSVETEATRYIDASTWPADSYWWRVKVIAPFETRYSEGRVVTRRWLVPDASGQASEVARPDAVMVEGSPADEGVQAPINRIKISWEPVAEASYYVVQFDHLESLDPERPGVLPPYEFTPDVVCLTPHTVLTPNASVGDSPLPTPPVELNARFGCDITEVGQYWIRVRAVDERVTGTDLYSLWSDEARAEDESAPGPAQLSVTDKLRGSGGQEPAVLTAPSDDSIFVDAPSLEWEPVVGADYYRVTVALDRDFTSDYAWYWTTNTRLIPLGRLPEESALRSYYWYVVPCRGEIANGECVTSNKAVNRNGRYRTFKKVSPEVELSGTQRAGTPWTRFNWQSFSQTSVSANRKYGRAQDSVGGFRFYEIQFKPRGGAWSASVPSDVPMVLPVTLAFGIRYRWRVRVVDGSGQARPWGSRTTVQTAAAIARDPVALKAVRSRGRVTLQWRAPKSKFFPIQDYTVYYSTKGKRWKPLSEVPRTRAAFRVAKGVPYWFMVTANNRAGASTPSRVFVPK